MIQILQKGSEVLYPIEKAPFYAGKLLATFTMCGLHTDESLLVLDKDDKPIENLYVAGATQGNLFAGDYPTNLSGIALTLCGHLVV